MAAAGSPVQPCGTLGWGLNTIAAIAPGGASFALATSDGHFETRRFSDSSKLGIHGELSGATSIGYSADGSVFAASTSQALQVWRVSDGLLLSSIPSLANANALGVSNDGSVVAVRKSSAIKISRPAGLITIAGIDDAFAGVAVSPDGTLVAAKYWMGTGSHFNPHGYYDGAWRVSDGQAVWASANGAGLIEVLGHAVFSPDGTLIAFGFPGAGGGSRLLHASDGSVVYSFNEEPAAFSPTGSRFSRIRSRDGRFQSSGCRTASSRAPSRSPPSRPPLPSPPGSAPERRPSP